jgi:hypothetical protein
MLLLKRFKKYSIFTLIPFLTFIACDKKPTKEASTEVKEGRLALIVNEGAYGYGNASISLYNITTGEIHNEYFKFINQEDLGDVVESANIIDDQIFICVNNSNVIKVLDKKTFRKITDISVSQPRYCYPINDSIAYITSFYFNKIHIINTKTHIIIGEITMPYPHIEQLLIKDNKAYVCNWNENNNKLYVINTDIHSLTDSIMLEGKAPHSIFEDKSDNIWVLGGNKEKRVTSSFTVINNHHQSVKSFVFEPEKEIVSPIYDVQNDQIYYIDIDYDYKNEQGIYKMLSTANALPTARFITAGNYQYFYKISIDTKEQNLYISDPKGFNQNGVMDIYDYSGNKKNSITTSLGPSYTIFLD